MKKAIRFLDPQRREYHKALVRHTELEKERKSALVMGKRFMGRKAHSETEDLLFGGLEQVPRVVSCFRCGNDLDLGADPHWRTTIACDVGYNQPGSDGPEMVHVIHPAQIVTAKIGVLRAPHTGEIALCEACHTHLAEYMAGQELEVEI